MSLSAWMTQSGGGDFANMKIVQLTSNGTVIGVNDYSDWVTKICETSPYTYIEPFSFTFQANGVKYSNQAYCGFPRSNSVLRICTCILTALLLVALFFETPLSSLGRTSQMIMGALFFASFVLDADAVATGTATCQNSFANTFLNTDINTLGAKLTCDMSNYAGVAVISLLLSALLLLLQAAWSNCTDMYSGIPKASAAAREV